MTGEKGIWMLNKQFEWFNSRLTMVRYSDGFGLNFEWSEQNECPVTECLVWYSDDLNCGLFVSSN